ncbi:hypothetical protein [Streptomyces ardesiacus]|uniref:hypothetical protein n=1 Tax=Streptomyces ardesiacus TaxID=285564 RepID=UPI000D590182|nr:hypothetical protein [Streptomyces ardesiacus]
MNADVTALEETLVAGEETLRGRHGATDRAVELLVRYRAAIAEEVTAALGKEDPNPPTPAGMARAEAVETAIKHVEKMSTNARGYQNGTNLAAKTQAVATFVELLMGEGTSSRE